MYEMPRVVFVGLWNKEGIETRKTIKGVTLVRYLNN